MRVVAASVVCLLLSSCSEFTSTYGTWGEGSINGLNVLKSAIENRYESRQAWRLSNRLSEKAMVIGYVETATSLIDPHAATKDWIDDWLRAKPDRHLILFLRDQSIGTWLCRRWHNELQARYDTLPADDAQRATIAEQIELLDTRADIEEDGGILADTNWRYFRREQVGLKKGKWALTADAPLTVPSFFETTSQLVPHPDYPFTPIITVDGACQMGYCMVGGSRLTVVTNTLPFLDAAQVDHDARSWLDVFLATLPAESDETIWWTKNLVVNDSEDPLPPSILHMLFSTPPFNIIILHFFIAVALWLWIRSRWLGRVNPSRRNDLRHFNKHVLTLADRLAHQSGTKQCQDAIQKYHTNDSASHSHKEHHG